MPASTDFPRGWTATTFVSGSGTATITIPASAGIIHVLDSLYAKIINASASAFAPTVTLSTSDGTYSGLTLAWLDASAGSGTVASLDSETLVGIGMNGGPGASLTVSFSTAAVTSVGEFLILQGHDI